MLQSNGLQRAGHDWATEQQQQHQWVCLKTQVALHLAVSLGVLGPQCLLSVPASAHQTTEAHSGRELWFPPRMLSGRWSRHGLPAPLCWSSHRHQESKWSGLFVAGGYKWHTHILGQLNNIPRWALNLFCLLWKLAWWKMIGFWKSIRQEECVLKERADSSQFHFLTLLVKCSSLTPCSWYQPGWGVCITCRKGISDRFKKEFARSFQ